MKTSVLSLLAILFFSTTSIAQQGPSVFENASLVQNGGSSYILLNWKKGSENTAYYLVERSVDGKEFKQAALVFTSENPEFVQYKFKDKVLGAANNAVYYRISIVNDQKELTYLPVKKVSLAIAGASAGTEKVAEFIAK